MKITTTSLGIVALVTIVTVAPQGRASAVEEKLLLCTMQGRWIPAKHPIVIFSFHPYYDSMNGTGHFKGRYGDHYGVGDFIAREENGVWEITIKYDEGMKRVAVGNGLFDDARNKITIEGTYTTQPNDKDIDPKGTFKLEAKCHRP